MNLSPEIIAGKNFELSEALSVGGTTTLVGLGIVFGVLVILMLVLMLFKVLFYKPEAKKEVKNEAVANEKKAVSVNESPNDETTAVMVAAIAACMDTRMDKIRIKSIKKI